MAARPYELSSGAGPTLVVRDPLASPDSEEYVLAAMLADAAAVSAALAVVTARDFAVPDHQLIFAAIAALAARRDPVDHVALLNELDARGYPPHALVTERVEGLADVPALTANVGYHLRTVRDLAQRRDAREATSRFTDALADTKQPIGEILSGWGTSLMRLGVAADSSQGAPPFLSAEEVEQLPAPQFLVADLIPLGGTAEIHGPPGCGKSFFALGLALDVAAGRPFLGRPVQQGRAVYVAAEGAAGLGVRIRAWKADRGVSHVAGVDFYREAVLLLEAEAVGRFIAHLRALDEPPALVVLDTLARCMVGGEENSARDMGLAIAAVDRIRRDTGAAVLVLHHSRKDGETERGSTALRGAVDTMLAIRNEGGALRVSCEKQKDAAPFASFDASLRPAAGSCAIGLTEARDLFAQIPTEHHKKLLVSLNWFQQDGGAASTRWMESTEVPKPSFHRLRSDLVAWGYVDSDKQGRTVRYRLSDRGATLIGLTSQKGLGLVSETDPGLVSLISPSLRGERHTGTDRRSGR